MSRSLPAEARAPRVPQTAREPQVRSYELDWLRAFIVLALVPAHAMGFFTVTTSQYFDTQYASPVGLSTLMSLGSWGIGLLFLVSGAATSFMLGRYSSRKFVSERFVRLLIPTLFASLALIPLQDYLLIHTFPGILDHIPIPKGWDQQVAGSPATFYMWFAGAYVSFITHYTPRFEFIFWSHLWFIPRLLVISLLTLPLLLYLRTPHGSRSISWLAAFCMRYRGAVFLLAVPLVLINAVLGWQWQGWQVVGAPDGANVLAQFLFYTIVYVYGYILYADVRLRFAVRRDSGATVIVIALLAFAVTQLPGVGNQALAHDYSAGGLLSAALRGVAAWLCIVGVVGLSMRYLTFTNSVGHYFTEASYPFYVLHLAVLYLIGLPLLTSGAPALVSFVVMVVLTYAITLAMYDVFIRRVPPLRALFGMRKQSLPPPSERHAAHANEIHSGGI
jgi:hypothetical protein